MTGSGNKTQTQKPAGGATAKPAPQKPENKAPVKPTPQAKPTPQSKPTQDQDKRIHQLINEVRLLEKTVLELKQKKELEAVAVMLPVDLLARLRGFLIDYERATGFTMGFSDYVRDSLAVCIDADEEEWRREQEEQLKELEEK
jgi:hypothetical protein